MNPDQEHEKYYRENPQGNHFGPSDETLRFMKEQGDTNKTFSVEFTDIKVTLARMEQKIDANLAQATKTNGRVTALEEYKPILEEMKEKKKVWLEQKIALVVVVLGGGVAMWFINLGLDILHQKMTR